MIADVVETGTTLRAAGLEIIGEPILQSEAVLVRRTGARRATPRVDQLVRRLQGVLVARAYVMMDYDIQAELVEQACALTPGHRVADRLAAARGGLGRRACDGARAATPTGSWTSSGSSARAASSSPTSTPAGSDGSGPR